MLPECRLPFPICASSLRPKNISPALFPSISQTQTPRTNLQFVIPTGVEASAVPLPEQTKLAPCIHERLIVVSGNSKPSAKGGLSGRRFEPALSLGKFDFEAGVLGEGDLMSAGDPGVKDHLTDLIVSEAANQAPASRGGSDDPGQQI
jgi:hypothetical protein